MKNEEFNAIFNKRAFEFSVRTFKLIDGLDRKTSAKVIGYQLGKSASSVGANFRAFCRGRSYREKYAKICIVVEEADETLFWFDNLKSLSLGNKNELNWLAQEAEELLKITSKIKSTLRKNPQ